MTVLEGYLETVVSYLDTVTNLMTL